MKLQHQQKIIITLFCFIISLIIFKAEVLDHPWITITRDSKGFVDGYYTAENAIKRGSKSNFNIWETEIVNNDSFKYRKKINIYKGYVLPLGIICISLIMLFPFNKSK